MSEKIWEVLGGYLVGKWEFPLQSGVEWIAEALGNLAETDEIQRLENLICLTLGGLKRVIPTLVDWSLGKRWEMELVIQTHQRNYCLLIY